MKKLVLRVHTQRVLLKGLYHKASMGFKWQTRTKVFRGKLPCFVNSYKVAPIMIADKIHKLELLLNEKDQDLSYSLSVSSGYAYYQPDTDMDFKDIVRRSDTMLYREKRRKKISHSASSHPMLSSGKQSRAQGITDELITQEKKYQHISPTELCGIIDVDNFLYISPILRTCRLVYGIGFYDLHNLIIFSINPSFREVRLNNFLYDIYGFVFL